MYKNYCIFQTPSQKSAQNIQFLNIQKSKISNSDFSKTWRENMENMLDITTQIILFLAFIIPKKRVIEYF